MKRDKRKSDNKLRRQILTVLESSRRPLSSKGLLRLLKNPHSHIDDVDKILNKLTREKKVKVSRGRYSLLRPTIKLSGRVTVKPGGYGFVSVAGYPQDIFIPPGKMSGAFHNDIVEVEVFDKAKEGRLSGKVISIERRGMRKVIGRIIKDRKGMTLRVEDKKYQNTFDVFSSNVKRLKNGLIVEGLIEGKSRRRRRGVQIIRVLGDTPDVESLTLSSIYTYGLEDEPDSAVLAEAKGIPRSVRKSAPGRVDLTQVPFITIDGEDAKDFDDAVFIEKDGRGFHLMVSIADVSAYVMPGSPLDREAKKRGTSVYFPDRVIPMFPETLSNGICSLKEGVNRLSVTADLYLSHTGDMLDVNFYPSVMKNHKRLTYKKAQRIIDSGGGKKDRLAKMLSLMADLSRILKEKRVDLGSLDFDLPETRVKISYEGVLKSVERDERFLSHKIIEEFMLLTNVAVAKHLNGKNIPFLYRVHEDPDMLKVREFFKFSANFKDLKNTGFNSSIEGLREIMEKARGKSYEKIVNLMMLRSFKLARYTPHNSGHFGLAFKTYTHFTSPIRRYPDLIAQRAVKYGLGDEAYGSYFDSLGEKLPQIGDELSEKERMSEQAERDVVDKLKALYMIERVGEVYRGIITSVHPFGYFVELETLFLEGLVHSHDLPGDHYYLDRDGFSLRGLRFGNRFSIGETVVIKVKESDPFRGTVDFLFVEKERGNSYN